MNPKYVVSLELAKQLKDCDVPQESEWYWWVPIIDREYPPPFVAPVPTLMPWNVLTDMQHFGDKYKDSYSAFHVGELGQMLPANITGDIGIADDVLYLVFRKQINNFGVEYRTFDEVIEFHNEYADTEAEARGKMLLYLKKDKLI